MLRLVYARSGSRKKDFLLNAVRESRALSRQTMLVVPEQSSFEAEKEMYLSLGDSEFPGLEVLSFTKLCRIIGNSLGRSTGKKLSLAGKLILSSCAASLAVPDMKVYTNQAENASFVQKLSAVVDELKAAGISPKDFENGINTFEGSQQLKNKLSDISALYRYYDLLLSRGYLDPADAISDALYRVGDGSFFKDYDIIIDGFASFSGNQLSLIGKMLSAGCKVTAVLCTSGDNPGVCPAAFKTPADTAQKLLRIAASVGAKEEKPVELEAGTRYENESVRSLEEFAAGKRQNILPGSVFLCCEPDIRQECRRVAAEIRRLVIEKGLRYREIAVIGRNMTDYLCHIEDSFSLYDIPFFSDARAGIDTRPCVIFIVNLLEVLISGIDTPELKNYLKCGLSPIDDDDAAQLENYIDLWKLNKSEIMKDFEKNPDGLEGDPDIEALEYLSYLNKIRKKAIEPLAALSKELIGASGEKITRAIYEFMENNGVIARLSKITAAADTEDSALAAEQYRAFKTALSVMEQLAALLRDDSVTLKRYLELFRLSVSAEDVGSIPHHLDEVQVGDAGRMRTSGIKAVFLVGMSEGSFPARHTEDNLFTDGDRRLIREAGMDILTPSGVMNQNEQFYLYSALTCASQEVYLSFSRKNQQGDDTFPSKIIDSISKALGENYRFFESGKEELLGTDAADFELMCTSLYKKDELYASLYRYFAEQNGPYSRRLERIRSGLCVKTDGVDKDAAQSLYGDKMVISPSQIEKYHLCKFGHFCSYGLRLKTQKHAEVTAMDSGNAVHDVMERLLKEYSKDEIAAFSNERLRNEVRRLLREFIGIRMGAAAMGDNRVRYSVMRLENAIVPTLRYIIDELEQSGFSPRGFEVEVKTGGGVEPYLMKAESGAEISVCGKIDRVDVRNDGEKTYVRVVDYKSGAKKFDRRELPYGINLQMFLYLFSIWENGGDYEGNITPSGVLYMPVRRPDIKGPAGMNDDEIRKKLRGEMKMSGMVLNDPGVYNDGLKGFYSASLGDISQFQAIKNQTEKLICKMADGLRLGELKIDPLYKGSKNVGCAFCDFAAVCTFEDGDPHRTMEGDEEE